MKFNDLSVKFKLWAIVLGLMGALVVLGAGLMVHTESVTKESDRVVAFGNERIFTALRWKSMTQSSVDNMLAAMQASEPDLSARLLAQAQKTSADVTELQ